MSDPLCPRCSERPRHRSPSGIQAYCAACMAAYRKEKSRPKPRREPEARPAPASPIAKVRTIQPKSHAVADARRAKAIAEGRFHVTADISFGRGRGSCTCGRFEVDLGDRPRTLSRDTALAAALDAHIAEANLAARPSRGFAIADAAPSPA